MSTYSINLTWTPSSTATYQEVRYAVQGTTTWTTAAILGPTITNYSIGGLITGTNYSFVIITDCSNGFTTSDVITPNVIVCITPSLVFVNLYSS